MSDRKFTYPTKLPAEYVTRGGLRAVIEAVRDHPFNRGSCVFVGDIYFDNGMSYWFEWNDSGRSITEYDEFDLLDPVAEPKEDGTNHAPR